MLRRNHTRPSQLDATALPVTLRAARHTDTRALQRLAILDSREAAPPGPHLLAERGPNLVAAVSLTDGSAIADPFEPTAGLVSLLRAAATGGLR